MILSSVAPTGFKDFPVNVVFPIIRKVGIEKVHVVRDEQNKWSASEILSALNDYGLIPDSYHSDFGEEFDLCADDKHARQIGIDSVCREADFALEIGAKILVIHPSGYEGNVLSARDNFRKSLEHLAKVIEQLNIKCCIENLPKSYSYGSSVADLAEDIASISSANLGICFDTGHSNINKQDVSAELLEADNLLWFIHAHDNDGNEDQHKLPFTGTIDWDSIADALRKMKYCQTFCLEVFEDISVIEEQLRTGWLEKLQQFVRYISEK